MSSTTVTASNQNGTTYYYKVLTKGDAGESYYSGLSSAQASLKAEWSNCSAPTSVTGPTNVIPSSSQTISWAGAQGGTNNPITSYKLFSSADNYAAAIATTTSTSATVTAHATNGSSITYKVQAVSAANSVMSTASHTMKSFVGVITPPATVTLAKNNLGPGATTSISWTAASGGTNNAFKHYIVQTNAGGSWANLSGNTTLLSYSPVTSPTANNSGIGFRIAAVGERSTAYSAVVSLNTKVTKPGAPTSVSVNDGGKAVDWNKQLTLSWSGASNATYNNNILSYQVYVSTNGGAYTKVGKDIPASGTSGNTQITSLTANGTQKFIVRTKGQTSITAEQISADSPAVTVTTRVGAPTAPTASIPSSVPPGSSQSLTWSGAQNGENNPISKYIVQKKIGSGSWDAGVDDSASPYPVTSSTTNNAIIYYRVIAAGTGSRGNSAASNTVSMKTECTAPAAPTSVTINKSGGQIPKTEAIIT